MSTLRRMERSLVFVPFPPKLLTSINNQKFVSIDNKLNKIKIPWIKPFVTDLEYSGEREEQSVKRKHLNRRSWVPTKSKREEGNEERMVMGFITLSRPCISWLEPGKAVVLRGSCDCTHTFTPGKLTRPNIRVMCLGLECV